MQQLLQGGTVSFTVDGVDSNVLKFDFSTSDSKTIYPDLDPPTPVGRSTVKLTEYSSANWKPTISWGGSYGGSVFLDGDLPDGLRWDYGTQSITGAPIAQGTFPVTITVIGDTGEGQKSYSIVVGPSSAASQVVAGEAGTAAGNEDASKFWIDASGYFRPDNPAFATTLPIVGLYNEAEGQFEGPIDDVEILDPNGVPLPISGDFTIYIWHSWDGLDHIHLYGENLVTTDSGSPTVESLLAAGGSVKFRYGSGELNTIGFAPIS